MIQESVLKALNDAKTKRKLQNKTVTKQQQQIKTKQLCKIKVTGHT